MKRYKVTYADKKALKTEKVVLAESEKDVFAQLRDEGLTPLKIAEEKSSSGGLFSQKVRATDIETFITNLAALLTSGINLDKALNLIIRSSEKAGVQEMVRDIQNQVRAGAPLSAAMASYENLFDELTLRLVEIGEETGTLDSVLHGLSEQLKFQQKMRSQIKQALIYPAVIVFVCISSVLFILISVVPQLSTMLESQQNLPVYTQALMSLSEWIRSTQGIVILLAVVVTIAVLAVSTNAQLVIWRHKIIDSLKKLPLVSGLAFLAEQVRFSSAMRVTLNSGLSLTKAIELSARTLNTLILENKLLAVSEKVKSGEKLSAALENGGLLESMEIGYVEVGEETGDLARAFTEIQQRKGTLFDTRLSTFLKLLEPLLILVMGALVGGVVIVMMLSIMSAQDVGM